MTDSSSFSLMEVRIAQLEVFLEDEAPYARFDQRHLDPNSPEKAYWHLGYRAALVDALALLRNEAAGTDGTSNQFPEADPDE